MHRMRAFFVPESEAAYIAVRQPRGMVVMAVPVLLVYDLAAGSGAPLFFAPHAKFIPK